MYSPKLGSRILQSWVNVRRTEKVRGKFLYKIFIPPHDLFPTQFHSTWTTSSRVLNFRENKHVWEQRIRFVMSGEPPPRYTLPQWHLGQLHTRWPKNPFAKRHSSQRVKKKRAFPISSFQCFPYVNDLTGHCWFFRCSNEELLHKYGLKANDAILAEEKHMGLYDDLLENYDAQLIAGGAAQNTARGAQVALNPTPHPQPILSPSSTIRESSNLTLNPLPFSTSSPRPLPSLSAASATTNTPQSSAIHVKPQASASNTWSTRMSPQDVAGWSPPATSAACARTWPPRTSTRFRTSGARLFGLWLSKPRCTSSAGTIWRYACRPS